MPSFSNAPTSDRPTLLMVGDGDPMGPVLEEMLDKKGLFVERVGTNDLASSVQLALPDVILLVGDAAKKSRAVLDMLEADGTEVPVIVLSADAALEARLDAFKHGAAAVVPRGASADATAIQIRDLTRDLAVRFEQDTGEIGEATFDELVKLVSDELRSGILAVRPPGEEGGTMRLQLGAGRPVADAVKEFVARLKPHVTEAGALNYQFHASESDLLGDAAEDSPPSVFQGLRVLLVDDAAARADALAQELRARGAMVFVTDHEGRGLTRAGGLDPQVAIVDAVGIEGEGFAVIRSIRAHARLRWASILVAPWPEIWPDDRPIPNMDELAARLEPLLASEHDLVARCAEEERFNTRLEETGPSRMLRTLVESHATLHITVRSPKATVEIDVAEDLVVGARASLPDGPTPEGVSALATLMTMSSGRVRIERRERPTVANIMSPVDEALGAAVAEIPDKPLTMRPGPSSKAPTAPPPPNKPPSMAPDRSPRRPALPSAGVRRGSSPTPGHKGQLGTPSPVTLSERARDLANRKDRPTAPLDLPAAKVDAALNLLDSRLGADPHAKPTVRPDARPPAPPRPPRKRPKRRRASTLVFGTAPVVPSAPQADTPPAPSAADPLDEELALLDSEVTEEATSEPPAPEPTASEPTASEPTASEPRTLTPPDDLPASELEFPNDRGSVPAGSLPGASPPVAAVPVAAEPVAAIPVAAVPVAAEPVAASSPAQPTPTSPSAALEPPPSGSSGRKVLAALVGVVVLCGVLVGGYLASGASNPAIDGALAGVGLGTEPSTEEPSNPVEPAGDPVEPDPSVDPEPVDPEPVGPDSVDPEPPVDPEPATDPELANPEVADPEVADPEVADPEPADPELANPEPADPEPDPADGSEAPPSTAEDYLRLARQAGDTELGERYYRHVLTLDPSEHHAMVGLGRLLMARNRHGEAVEPLRAAVGRRSRRASYRIWLGDALAGSGDGAGAQREWTRALEIEPDNRDAHRRLGQ